MATLIIIEGPASGQQFAMGGHPSILIGREEHCTFQILDDQMSRRHMQIKRADGASAHEAIDIGSTNGIIVNGHKVDGSVPLCDGDQIEVGGTRLVYTLADSPDAKTVSALIRKRGENVKGTIVAD